MSNNICIEYHVYNAGEIVNRVIEALNSSLARNGIENNKQGSRTLSIEILECTDGSRWGRICCAELGYGWIILDARWKVKDMDGKILKQGTKVWNDSGAIGLDDVCESDLGEKRLLGDMTPKLAMCISADVKSCEE